MNKEELLKKVKEDLELELTDNQMNQLDSFCKFLISENKKYNLTAITKLNDVYLKHFYDSLTILKIINLTEIKHVLDIGSGAGFPGIILAIAFPNVHFTLLDSNNKKANFLTQAIELIALNNVEVVNDRAENYIENKRESFDLVTSRAVARLNILSELAIPFVKLNKYFIAMKGDDYEEQKEAVLAIKELGGEISDIKEFELPVENSKRTLIKVTKKINTPDKYPRTYDKIMKNPLKK